MAEEIRSVKRLRVEKESPGGVVFAFRGQGIPWGRIQSLALATAVYKIIHFPVARPRALLGDQHFRRLVGEVEAVLHETGRTHYRTLVLQAAGRESSVMQRLAGELAGAYQLELAASAGDLAIRIRPAVVGPSGWEALVRLGSRPQSARAWRVVDMPGALNGPVAALMNRMVEIQPTERLLNVACGSGTLLIETMVRPKTVVGGDLNPAALEIARQNMKAACVEAPLVQLDGVALPFADRSFDVLTADLPWGQLVGSHQANDGLYPAFLAEAERILAPGGRVAVLTHDVRRFRHALDKPGHWRIQHDLSIKMGRSTPRLMVMLNGAG